MYSPTEFAHARGYWRFNSVLRLPSDATSPMQGMKTVCAEFAAVAGRQLGWGGSKLLEETDNKLTFTIGSSPKIILIAFWSEKWGYASCTVSTRDGILSLKIEKIIQQFLPRITPEELLAHSSPASLSDREVLMLCEMTEWGDAYSPSLSSILVDAWKTRPDELRYELTFGFQGIVPYWQDFYPLLKGSLETDLSPLLKDYVRDAVDLMEFEMQLEGQTPD